MKNHREADFPLLVGQSGPLNGKRFVIDQILTIGREQTCEVVIPDRQVSRFHARLIPRGEAVLLEDLGSKNGTFCNGKRVEGSIVLQDGDLIQIALVQHFVFLSSDATLPIAESALGALGAKPHPTQYRLLLDKQSHRVWVAGHEILPPLSVPQFRLLQVLYDHQGKAVSRQDIIRAVWGEQQQEGVSDQALDALVRRLRDRLNQADRGWEYILTVRGFGFRLENPTLD